MSKGPRKEHCVVAPWIYRQTYSGMNSARSTSGRQTQSNDFFFPKVFDVFLPLPCRGFFSSASVIPRGSLSLLSCLKEDAPTLGCPMFEALVVRFGSVLFYSRSACNWGKASGHLYAPPHRPESLSLSVQHSKRRSTRRKGESCPARCNIKGFPARGREMKEEPKSLLQ